MTIRVTVGSASAGALAGLQASSAHLAELQQQLSTGQQISQPSDDPSGTVRALSLRGDLKLNAQYARNQSDATAWLSVADSTYGQITDLVQKVRTLTVQASNTGASTGASAGAIGDQISAIREAIFKLANTTYNGRPIFGGTTGNTAAFDMDSAGVVTYVGDNGVVNRAIGDQNTVKISQTGSDVFGAPAGGGQGLFDLLSTIVTNLKGAGAPPANALSDLDGALNSLTSQRAQSGSALARVQAAQQTGATDKVTIQTNLSEIQDIDLAEVAIQMNTAQVVYQASLQTTANIRQLSLLNFLK
jgi:flagellar hook-associated protein 3 FlgL